MSRINRACPTRMLRGNRQLPWNLRYMAHRHLANETENGAVESRRNDRCCCRWIRDVTSRCAKAGACSSPGCAALRQSIQHGQQLRGTRHGGPPSTTAATPSAAPPAGYCRLRRADRGRQAFSRRRDPAVARRQQRQAETASHRRQTSWSVIKTR